MKSLEDEDEEVIVAIDEMTQLSKDIGVDIFTDFMFYINSLLLNSNLGDWSSLNPGSVTLLLSLQPVMSHTVLSVLPPVTSIIGPSTMEVYKLPSVFRNTQAIHNLLKHLHKNRNPSVKEAWCNFFRAGFVNQQLNPSCVLDPAEETQGHGVEGQKPQWIVVPRCPHMFCDDSVGCFLEANWNRIYRLLEDLYQEFGEENVTVLVDIGRNREGLEWIKQKTGKDRIYNVESFTGGETQALVFLQQGDYGKTAKYNGWSRGTSHLTIITDNTMSTTYWSLREAAREGFLQPLDIPPTVTASVTTIQRIFGWRNWIDFILSMFFLLPRLLLHIIPLMVASLLHGTGRTQCIKRVTDTRGGFRWVLEGVLTLDLLLSFFMSKDVPVLLYLCFIYSVLPTLAMLSHWSWRMWNVVTIVLFLIWLLI